MHPKSEAELADVLASGGGLFCVQGGGTRTIGRAQGEVLHTSGLTGITLYEPAALTLVVKAGEPLAQINALLAGERQRLGFEPPDLRALLGRTGKSTIGGVVAANASGPRRVQGTACRDALLGVRFVDGRGDAISSGGRVMKNVTGYDLVKLIAGSFGTLGVLSEVSLKLQSLPEAETTLVIEGLNDAAGLDALRAALGSPYDISGAARAGGRSYIRIEGMVGSVAYRAAQVQAKLLTQLQKTQQIGCDVTQVNGAASAAHWHGLRDVTHLAAHTNNLWRLSVLPSDAASTVSALMMELGGDDQKDVVYDWAGGLVWLALPEGADSAVRAQINGKGAAIKLRGADAAAFAPQTREVATLTDALRAQFDPRHRFFQGYL